MGTQEHVGTQQALIPIRMQSRTVSPGTPVSLPVQRVSHGERMGMTDISRAISVAKARGGGQCAPLQVADGVALRACGAASGGCSGEMDKTEGLWPLGQKNRPDVSLKKRNGCAPASRQCSLFEEAGPPLRFEMKGGNMKNTSIFSRKTPAVHLWRSRCTEAEARGAFSLSLFTCCATRNCQQERSANTPRNRPVSRCDVPCSGLPGLTENGTLPSAIITHTRVHCLWSQRTNRIQMCINGSLFHISR